MLGTIPDKFPSLSELSENVVAGDRNLTICRNDVSSKTLESGRFACAIHTEQCKAFTVVKTKGDTLNGKERITEPGRVGLAEVINSNHVHLRWALVQILRVQEWGIVFITLFKFATKSLLGKSVLFSFNVLIEVKVVFRLWDALDTKLSAALEQVSLDKD